MDVLNGDLPALEGGLDGIAYCPGSINLKPFKALKLEHFRADLEINLIAAVKLLKEYEKQLKAAEQASVVLFSTVAVGTGMPFHASIAAAKGAVEGLTRSPRRRMGAEGARQRHCSFIDRYTARRAFASQ